MSRSTGIEKRAGCFFYYRLFFIFFTAWMVCVGCGKKGPPVAPHQGPLLAVADLQADLGQGIAKLTWSHNPENWGAVEYVILQAQTDLSLPECPGCPRVFQKAGTIRLGRALRKEKHNLDFSQSLMPGFRYTFSVRPVHTSGAQGPDSNPVILELEK